MASELKISHGLMYEAFAEAVQKMIKAKRLWDRYLPPERELVEMFEVSRETVRRGLVLLENRGIISRQQGRGTLVIGKTKKASTKSEARILVGVCQGGGDAYDGEVIAGVTASAGRAGHLLSCASLNMPDERRKFFQALASGEAGGLLLLSVTDKSLLQDMLRVWRGPVVLADHYFADLPVTGVIDDGEGGARQAIKHLLDQGHRRIGYIDVSRRELNPWRYDGYAGALRDAGLAPDERLVVPAACHYEAGRRAAEQVLALPEPPTAILAFDEVRAWGAWRAAEARGLEVGKDLALVAFGSPATKAGLPPDLSIVQIDWRALGRVAAETLDALMAGKTKPGELVKIPTTLAVRKSSEQRIAERSGT